MQTDLGVEALPVMVVVVLVAGAVYTDLRHGKVFNFMTLPALAAGLALNTLLHGSSGFWFALGGTGLAAGLWVLTQALGQRMGGGDIKLLAAVGALCGARFLLASFVIAVLVGGVLAVVVALKRRQLGGILRRCSTWAVCRVGLNCPAPDGAGGGSTHIPYALPIALGVVGCLLGPGLLERW